MSRYKHDPVYREKVKANAKVRHRRLMDTDPVYREKYALKILDLRQKHGDKKNSNQAKKNSQGVIYWESLRNELITAYGGRCSCCGETEYGFLSLDHIQGGGRQHRRRLGRRIYAAIKREGFPKDKYQILCMNCNWATRGGKLCPHQIAVHLVIPRCS